MPRSLYQYCVGAVCASLIVAVAILAPIQANASHSLNFSEIIEFQQKTVFLLSYSTTNEAAKNQNINIARSFYYQKMQLLEAALEKIDESENHSRDIAKQLLKYTKNSDIRPADQLAFIDVVDSILSRHAQKPFLSKKLLSNLKNLEQQIQAIQSTYERDISDLYEKMLTRGTPLETWASYIEHLNQKYDIESIYQVFNQNGYDLHQHHSRGSATEKDSSLIWGYKIPKKSVVLTFDDGPHHKNTAAILDVLKQYDAKAYFFAVGKNIGKVKGDDIKLFKKSKQLQRALKEGHVLANHSFSHSVLTKFDKSKQAEELSSTNKLLTAITGEKTQDFRPPYGAKNKQLIQVSKDEGMRSVMWNIDSMDWGDPIPASIVKRTMAELKKQQRGILLFHDIHKQTVQALPLLLAELKKEGYKIVTLEGQSFKPDNAPAQPQELTKSTKSTLYGNSWALVIGINQYKNWPQLSYAVNDAKGVRQVLMEQFGFEEDKVFTLLDAEATRENIVSHLAETLSDPNKIKENDRVFVFYAGHGMTRVLPSGRNLGYIVPVDAALNQFHSKSISMTHLQDFSDMIPAKHLYFVMDSCYSGIALTRGAGSLVQSKYLDEVSSRFARQILTAGGADQEVADGGPNGHSIFTWSFLQGLKGAADLDKNHIITATELGAYVSPKVSDNSNQTPAFGNLVGSQGGEFIFELPSLYSKKEPEEHSETVEVKLAALKLENTRLRKEIERLNRQIGRGQAILPKSLTLQERRLQANKLHEEGLEYYRNNDYSNALKSLESALSFTPDNAAMVNDYGFILFRSEDFEKALKYLVKAIELDPERRPVYLNIADTLVKLNRKEEAISYFKYYLTLYPNSPLKERVDQFLSENGQE